eukprot:TRINITY_DN8352_c0_g1_i10.p1 TRINITY_DN8352_c0_g1~~TRINITY_DN8352_c0_g1_i10.p1  ORF type:complete len:300 (+),score=48.29 TRINITY_DN8352_c0_g1_i10:159-1058(+)
MRYCAYLLPGAHPEYVLIYDFQCYESRVIRLILSPPVIEYSVAINHPFLFVAGGVELETSKVSNKIWITSAGCDEVSMSTSKTLKAARKRPFLISGREDGVYIIGGWTENNQQSKVCEKLKAGSDLLAELPQISIDHDQILGTEGHVFAFGRYDSRRIVESLNMDKEDKGWVTIVIKSDNIELPITYLDSFGVFTENELGGKILIFGGQKMHYQASSQVATLDANSSTLEVARNPLPRAEKFLQPMTENERTGFALSESLKLYVYDKKGQSWKVMETNIRNALAKKGIELKCEIIYIIR